MTSKSKKKGSGEERRVAKVLSKIAGWAATRVPGSGAFPNLPGDVTLRHKSGATFLVQCKLRANGWREVYKFLAGHSVLVLRADNRPAVYCVDEKLFTEMVAHWRPGAVPMGGV